MRSRVGTTTKTPPRQGVGALLRTCDALTDAAEILHPGWKKESRAGIAAPPVVGEGLFWKSHLFGICNDGCMPPLAGQRTKRRDAGAETGSLLQCHVFSELQEVMSLRA